MMNTFYTRWLGGKQGGIAVLLMMLLIFVVMPAWLDIFRLNLVGKYLTYAFAAVSLVMVWGYGGVLSLGQGIFSFA